MGWPDKKYGTTSYGHGKGQGKDKDNYSNMKRYQNTGVSSSNGPRDPYFHDALDDARQMTALFKQKETERAARKERKTFTSQIKDTVASTVGELLGFMPSQKKEKKVKKDKKGKANKAFSFLKMAGGRILKKCDSTSSTGSSTGSSSTSSNQKYGRTFQAMAKKMQKKKREKNKIDPKVLKALLTQLKNANQDDDFDDSDDDDDDNLQKLMMILNKQQKKQDAATLMQSLTASGSNGKGSKLEKALMAVASKAGAIPPAGAALQDLVKPGAATPKEPPAAAAAGGDAAAAKETHTHAMKKLA
eukprot:921378-Pyramimonas_sp.AAC.1